MADLNSLLSRIDGEFAALDSKIKKAQADQLQQYQQREKRLEQFAKTLDDLREVWGPRLQTLVQRFGDRVQTTPRLQQSSREVVFEFKSNLARIRLRFSAAADRDIHNVILAYDLEIIPVLMRFEAHSELEMPLDAVDKEKIAAWIDDRIISFVRSYLALHENDYYLKEHMVEDPIAGVRFPKYAAAATLEWQGKKYYFASEETRQEFAKKNAINT